MGKSNGVRPRCGVRKNNYPDKGAILAMYLIYKNVSVSVFINLL
jgi:hypothetical protein